MDPGDPGGAKCAGTQAASAAGVRALSESFFRASGSWQSEGLFGLSFSIVPLVQALRGLLCLMSVSVVWHIRHIKWPPPGWGLALLSTYQHLMGQAVDCSAAGADAWGERGYGDGSPLT